MKRFALVLVAALLSAAVIGTRSRAADDGSPHSPLPGLDPAVNEFWGRWEGVKPSEAIRRAGPTVDYQRQWDELGQHADDFQAHSGGRCLGHSEIARKSLGDNMQYMAFYAIYDPTPLRVQLLMYRAKDTWTVLSLRVDGEPGRWLEEAAQSMMPTPPQSAVAPQ